MAVYATVKGNTAPAIKITLRRDKQPIDLTGVSSVKLIIKNPLDKEITNTSHQNCTVLDAEKGLIGYQLDAQDFPATKNKVKYIAEVKITYGDNTVERIYEELQIIVRLSEE